MRKHQRIVAALLVTASLTAPGLAWADSKEPTVPTSAPISAPLVARITQAEAVAIAKRLFAIPAEMDEPNVGFSEAKEYAIWRMEWRTTDKRAPQVSISVEVDANTGKVRGYGRWQADTAAAPLSYTRTEAQKVAETWLEKLGAELKPTLRYRDLNEAFYYGGASASYSFHWDRLSQGYPVSGQGVDIAIDARTGELERFSSSWTDSSATYTLPKEIATRAQAEALYRSQLPMVLQYQRFVTPGTDDARWQLVYRPLTGYAPLVSADGKALLDFRNTPVEIAKFKDQPVVPVPIAPYKRPAAPLTQEQALKLAQAVSGRTEEPSSVNYNEYGDKVKQRAWDFSWSGPAEEKGAGRHTNVRIDTEAGTVLSLYNWPQGGYEPLKEGEEPKLTLEQARQNAIGLMLRFRPDLAGAARMQPNVDEPYKPMRVDGRPSVYQVRFSHLRDGIPLSEAGSSFDIDARTGEVLSFNSYDARTEMNEFPKSEGLIEPAKALEALLAQQPLELVWTSFHDPMLPGKTEPAGEQAGPLVALVWAPSQGNVAGIDAKLGVPLDGDGRDLIEAAKRPVDIAGHFAQREIELLWARGVFELKDGKFNPGDSVTIEELARWLVLARGMQPYPMFDFRGAFGGANPKAAATLANSVNAGFFGAAFQSGIFVPEDFTADLDLTVRASREQFALWAARSMGYGAIAKMENRIAVSFSDRTEIDAKYANAVGILEGLGVVKGGGNGIFSPKRLITRGEAAKLLFAISSQPRR